MRRRAPNWTEHGKPHGMTTRVLVVLSPRMYREAIALSVHRGRPDLDVKVAPPESAESEIAAFRPDLLIHNDTAQIDGASLAEVPFRVEVLYSDGLDARVSADGEARRIDDASTEDLLGLVDRASGPADG